VNIWEIIILGIVEGVTEFLPISSTGHLILVERWLKLATHPTEMFNVVIQSGAVIAVAVVFWNRIKDMVTNWKSPEVQQFALKIALSFFITGVGGLVLKNLGLKLPETAAPVAWATLIGGVVILAMERWLKGKAGSNDITWTVAIAVAGAQLLAAAFPGTSRSGASIIIALLCGIARPAATEFSFLVGVPTLIAAGGYTMLKSLNEPHEPWWQIGLGTFVSAVTAFIVVRWLLQFVRSHTFVGFGWYRIILGGIILGFLVLG
jgi:undecaprenyl-diphosphatase